MRNTVLVTISSIFAAIWMMIVFTQFWRYDPSYSKSIQLFHYTDLLIFLLAIGFGIVWTIKKRKEKAFKYLNGFTVFLGLLILDVATICFFYGKLNGLDLNIAGLIPQMGYFTTIAFCTFLVYLFARLLGTLLTGIFPMRISKADMPVIQAALGIMTLTMFLFFLGICGLLYVFVLLPICLFILSIYWRQSMYIVKSTFFTPITIPKNLNAIGVFSFLFLAVFLVVNFVLILRPFPIGSDSLNLYVNLPSLLSEYNSLVSGNQPYNWSLFMSVGLLVFGKLEVVLALSFLGGLLSLAALYRLSRKWLDINYSALVLALFYSLPMINFLSYMDMKVDMGLLFITLSILLLYYNWIVKVKDQNELNTAKGLGIMKSRTFFKNRIPQLLKDNRILVMIGLLAGFGFGIKLTILFFFLAFHCTIWFVKGDKLTFLASFFICLAAIFILKLDTQPGLRQFHQNVGILQWGLLAAGLGILGYLFVKKKEKLLQLTTYSLIVGGFFLLPILPWIGKNYSESGRLSVTSLLNGKKASPIFNIGGTNNNSEKDEVVVSGVYQLPAAEDKIEKIEKRRNRDLNNSISEDLHRFMGYEITPIRYLSLPFDVFIKNNISKYFTDIGFILLLLFPILFLFPETKELDWKSIIARFSFMALSTLLLIIAIPSAFMNQHQLTNPSEAAALLRPDDSSGVLSDFSNATIRTLLEVYAPINEWISTIYLAKDPITYPTLILLFVIIISLIYGRVRRHAKITQSMVIFLVMYFFLWWILGSGVAWYGMLIFSMTYIFLLKGIFTEKEATQVKDLSKWKGLGKKTVFLSCTTIWLLMAFIQRSTNYSPINEEKAKHLYYPSILEYQLGNLSEQKLMDYHFPNVRQLSDIINKDKKALIYRVGTPFNYFIDKNDNRVLGDNFLDFFERLMNQYETKDQIIKVLKDKGFRYIIFDLNMAVYDETPGKTLTRKFTQFMNTIYANPAIELLATDRTVKLNDTGQVIFEVFQDKGTIVNSGQIALYKIR